MIHPGDYITRQATEKDLPALTCLLHVLFSIEEDFSFDEALQRHGLMLLLETEQSIILVAEYRGQVVGMCTGQMLISTATGGRKVVVEDVVVLPEHQRCGVGRRLLTAIGDWAGKKGASRLQLLADRNNSEALRFYNHLDWKTTQLICLHKHVEMD